MLVMELMQNGDLRSALHSDTEGALRWYRTCVTASFIALSFCTSVQWSSVSYWPAVTQLRLQSPQIGWQDP